MEDMKSTSKLWPTPQLPCYKWPLPKHLHNILGIQWSQSFPHFFVYCLETYFKRSRVLELQFLLQCRRYGNETHTYSPVTQIGNMRSVNETRSQSTVHVILIGWCLWAFPRRMTDTFTVRWSNGQAAQTSVWQDLRYCWPACCRSCRQDSSI